MPHLRIVPSDLGLIGTAPDGSLGRQNSYPVLGIAVPGHHFCRRRYHADHRYIRISVPEILDTGGTYGVTCYAHHLHVVLCQKLSYLHCELPNGINRFGAVGSPRRIAEKNHPLIRQMLHQMRYAGQAAYSRIKNAYWSVVHL